MSVEAVAVAAEVREVENNILEMSGKLRLSKSIQRDPGERGREEGGGAGQRGGIFMKAIFPVWNKKRNGQKLS